MFKFKFRAHSHADFLAVIHLIPLPDRSGLKLLRAWAATFPDNIGNISQSTMFITRCIYVAFSHVLACRKLLPDNTFKKRNIDGMFYKDQFCKLRAYVMNSSEVLGARLVEKFRGVTIAIEQRYLRELTLVVSGTEEDLNDAIEMYTWRMRYDIDGEPEAELRQPDGTVMARLQFKGMEYLKKQTTELLLMLRALCGSALTSLPAGATSALRITYTDRTPKGYQAPGFHRSPDDPVLRPDARQVKLATLQTEYHGASVIVQSVFIKDEYVHKMRLREQLKLCNLNDSLNNSFQKEADEGDGAHRSVNNDTIERISEATLQQVIYNAYAGFPGMAVDRGSVADLDSSNITTPTEDYTRRSRRGRHAVKKEPCKPVYGPSGSPASATSQVVNVSTPPNKNPVIDPNQTPLSGKTPGVSNCARVTPKEPPSMGIE
uniref:HORMA domain-containing protein n=1 Tax=Angiostrongylus cantonensis TaxID=6313 RepID=A0A0K0DCL8_ANGCA